MSCLARVGVGALLGATLISTGVASAQPQSWVFGPPATYLAKDEPPNACAPANTLWHDVLTKLPLPNDMVTRPTLRLQIPEQEGRIGSARSVAPKAASTASEDPAPFRVSDLSRIYEAGRATPSGVTPGDYLGVIIPPGANDSLAPDNAQLATGRGGAILLVPTKGLADVCAKLGVPGYIIHAGKTKDIAVLGALPSMIMDEDDLVQLIANLMARSGKAAAALGKPYKEVVLANVGVYGGVAFEPINVVVERPPPRGRKAPTIRGYPKSLPKTPLAPVRLMNLAELWSIQRNVGGGYAAYFEDFAAKVDLFYQQMGMFASAEQTSDRQTRKAQIIALSQSAGEALAYVPYFQGLMRDAKAAGEIPLSDKAYNDLIETADRHADQISKLKLDMIDQLDVLERMGPDGYLDVAQELKPDAVDAKLCRLEPHGLQPWPMPLSAAGKTLNGLGQGVVFFRNGGSADQFTLNIRALLNATDARRIQAELADERVGKGDCSKNVKIENKLHADGRGGWKGRSDVEEEHRYCWSFNYPCWRGYKTYSCKKRGWTKLFTVRYGALLLANSSDDADGFKVKLSGDAASDTIEISTAQVLAGRQDLAGVMTMISLRPSKSFLSESADALWYVVEMQSAPKTAAIMCGLQYDLERMKGL